MCIRARGGITTGFRDYPRMPRRLPANRAEYRNRSLAACRVVGLVREMGGEAMSKARTWSVRLSVDDLNASFCLLETDQEIAAWVRGLMRGLNAGDCKEGASKEYAEGWEIGRPAREKADEIRAERAEVGSVGGSKRVANAQAIASPNGSPIGKPTAQPERRTKNEEQQEQITRPRQAAFTPPSEQEWVEYCTRTWSDWHPVCAGESWAYYQGVGWIVGRKICKDWKSTARTAHGNARQWGKLQPQRQAWAPPVPPPITCKPGELDGISKEATDRL